MNAVGADLGSPRSVTAFVMLSGKSAFDVIESPGH